jgi:hypothetical protein
MRMCEKEKNTEKSLKDSKELEDTGKEEMARYYQRYNTRLRKWVKIDSDTGLIVGVKKSPGEYQNLPKKRPKKIKKKKKGFFDLF